MNWRPKDWEVHIKEQESFADKTRGIASGFSREDFEAGADAMLEAIQQHFNLTLLSLDYKKNPIVVKAGDRLVIGIKPESQEMPSFLSDICFNTDHILRDISIAALKPGDGWTKPTNKKKQPRTKHSPQEIRRLHLPLNHQLAQPPGHP